MLKSLYISNYILIDELTIKPHQYFNAITGQTGSGKSIILGALGLLLGQRFDNKHFYTKNKKCIIEAEFDIRTYNIKSLFRKKDIDYDPFTVVRREITSTGKSRIFINETSTNLESAKHITNYLLFIHSQDSIRLITDKGFQRAVVDILANNGNYLREYQEAFKVYKKAKKAYDSLLEKGNMLKSNFEFNTFQLEELQKLPLEEINLDQLEEKAKRIENKNLIKKSLNSVYTVLSIEDSSVESLLSHCLLQFTDITQLDPNFLSISQRLDSLLIEVRDIINDLDNLKSKVDEEEESPEVIYNQLNDLQRLFVKHQVRDIESLLKIKNTLQKSVNSYLSFDDEIKSAKIAKDKSEQKARNLSNKLSIGRQKNFSIIQEQVKNLGQRLAMPAIQFEIKTTPCDFYDYGTEEISYYFSANKGIAPILLSKAVSGGECSRLTLMFQYLIAGKSNLPCLIIDEIDTGISGAVAIQIAEMIYSMSRKHQIIAITHQPQVAAKADKHYLVYKQDKSEKTISKIKNLAQEERVIHIAQMISGDELRPGALQNAKELLDLKK